MEELVPEPEVWTAHLRKFLDDCICSPACEEADRIYEAALLLRCGKLAGTCDFAADPAHIEAMLESQAPESAVMTMLPPRAAFILSRGQGGACLATVIVDEDGDEVIAEAATMALSLLTGYVAGLLAALEGGAGGPHPPVAESGARLH